MSHVFKTPLQFDPFLILKHFEDLGVEQLIHPDYNTLNLTCREGAENSDHDGLNSGYFAAGIAPDFLEHQYSQLNPRFKGSCFEMIWREVTQYCVTQLHLKVGRARFFRRPTRTTSSIHYDLDPRIHLVVKTNQDSILCFEPNEIYRLPQDGAAYFLDTTAKHFAVNANLKEDRIHLVFSTYEETFRNENRKIPKETIQSMTARLSALSPASI